MVRVVMWNEGGESGPVQVFRMTGGPVGFLVGRLRIWCGAAADLVRGGCGDQAGGRGGARRAQGAGGGGAFRTRGG
jgi:hypothetical protein